MDIRRKHADLRAKLDVLKKRVISFDEKHSTAIGDKVGQLKR